MYDNNSTDGTQDLARTAGAVVRHEYQQGKGNVIRRMFREIDAEAYIMVDGDDTYPAEAAPEMVKAVTETPGRYGGGGSAFLHLLHPEQTPVPQFWQRPGAVFYQQPLRRPDQGIMTGYRAFSYSLSKPTRC